MTVIQTMGGGGSDAGALLPSDVLLLHARAVSRSADADDAAAAACKAVGADPLTLAGLQANAATLAKVRASSLAVACVKLSRDAAKALGLDEVDVTDADEMSSLAADTERLASFCGSASQLAAMALASVNSGTVRVIQAINQSRALLQSVFDTVTGSSRFSSSLTVSEDSVSSLDSDVYGYSDCIILVATGYWSSTSQYTNVFLDGTQVSSGRVTNTQQPYSVTRANIGAITLQPATFTETGDAFAAVHVYTAS